MDVIINTEMLILAREARGLSQLQLAEAIGMSATNLSKIERADISIGMDTLEKIAEKTGFPFQFFTQPGSIVPENLNYRKREVVAQKLITPVHAQANIIRLQVQLLAGLLRYPTPKLPVLPVTDNNSPAQIATQLRNRWQVNEPIINNLTQLIESQGIVTACFNFGTERIDSRSMLTDDKLPIIFTNSTLKGDRQRFSLAYQLGQLIMHSFTALDASVNIGHEANLFAAELLMPEDFIRKDFEQGITIPILAQLKTKWKVSMIALLYRADDLGYLTPNQKRYLVQQFNTLKIRRREPIELDIAYEPPQLFKQWMATCKARFKLSTVEMAALLCLHVDEYLANY